MLLSVVFYQNNHLVSQNPQDQLYWKRRSLHQIISGSPLDVYLYHKSTYSDYFCIGREGEEVGSVSSIIT